MKTPNLASMKASTDSMPLVSVIIPTYNYGRFLPKAIESVLNQTYQHFEIVVIDDGSTDDTMSVIQHYNSVNYFFQENMGLSSARNTGIKKSKGDFLVLLDADDWLQPDALEQNLMVLKDKPHIAFISGNYYLLRDKYVDPEPVYAFVDGQHYIRLLESNYIGMHAAVMFQRWVFQNIQYDTALKACEDYDLYLTIARNHPVLHHQKFIATYYFHSSGLSHNRAAMAEYIKVVFKKHARFIRSAEEKEAYVKGVEQWKEYQQLITETV